MDRQFIVTVDRASIDAGHASVPIRVHHLPSDRITFHTRLALDDAIIVSGPQRQDGSRVWIEAAGVEDVHA